MFWTGIDEKWTADSIRMNSSAYIDFPNKHSDLAKGSIGIQAESVPPLTAIETAEHLDKLGLKMIYL